MKYNDFLDKYAKYKVKFFYYHNYCFFYEGTGPEGEKVTVGIGGNCKNIYHLEVHSDDEHTIASLISSPITFAEIIYDDREVYVDFKKQSRQEDTE